MVRRLTLRTVHVWIVNIYVCGSMVIGEIFLGPRLSVNTSRGGDVWGNVRDVWGSVQCERCVEEVWVM